MFTASIVAYFPAFVMEKIRRYRILFPDRSVLSILIFLRRDARSDWIAIITIGVKLHGFHKRRRIQFRIVKPIVHFNRLTAAG